MMYPKCGGHCCRQHQGWWPLSWRCVSTLTLGTLGALMPHSKSPTLQIQDLSGELQASPWWSFNLSGLSCDLCNVLWQLRLVNLLLFVGFLPQIAHHCQSLRTPKDFVITFYGVGPYKIVIGGTWLLPCCCGALQQVLSCQCFWALVPLFLTLLEFVISNTQLFSIGMWWYWCIACTLQGLHVWQVLQALLCVGLVGSDRVSNLNALPVQKSWMRASIFGSEDIVWYWASWVCVKNWALSCWPWCKWHGALSPSCSSRDCLTGVVCWSCNVWLTWVVLILSPFPFGSNCLTKVGCMSIAWHMSSVLESSWIPFLWLFEFQKPRL